MPFLKELKEVALPVRQPEQCYTGRGRSAFIAPGFCRFLHSPLALLTRS